MRVGCRTVVMSWLAEMNFKRHETEDVILEPGLHDGDGTVTRRRFFSGGCSRLPVRIEVWELPPGASEGRHVHAGDDSLEEFYYFIAGEGVMWMGDEEFMVGAGDAVMAPPGIEHGFRCTGDDALKLLIAWGEPEDQPSLACCSGAISGGVG